MTIGIYKLTFINTDKCYIGQSKNIERRFREHLLQFTKSTHSRKLQHAYKIYGSPKLEILIECSIPELNEVELEAINIFNSVDNGFNTLSNPNDTYIACGEHSGNSKFSNTQVLEVLDLLLTDATYKSIHLTTGVSIGIISKIAIGSVHLWLSEVDPKKYKEVLSKLGTRDTKHTVSEKLSAKSRGIIYPSIKSPSGIVYTIDNAYKFAKERNLAPNHFQEVLNGHRKSHKGWKLCLNEHL